MNTNEVTLLGFNFSYTNRLFSLLKISTEWEMIAETNEGDKERKKRLRLDYLRDRYRKWILDTRKEIELEIEKDLKDDVEFFNL